MNNRQKTEQQLIGELKELRQRVSKMEAVEEALQKSEERLELALKGADLGLWDYNLKTGETFINKRRAEMVGYFVDELGPHLSSWSKLVHPDDIDRVTNAFNAHAQGRTPLYECEHRLRHNSGRYIWILARAKVLERDEQGRPIRMVGTSLDISDRKLAEEAQQSVHSDLERRVEERTAELKTTNEQLREQIAERKRVEEALRESEERYRSLFEGSRDAIYLTDRDGRLDEANQAFLDLFGFTREEAKDVNILKVYREPADRLRFQERIERHGSLKDYEVKFQKKDGTEIDCLLTFTLRLDRDGNVLGYQGIARDITKRRRAEEALRESERNFRLVTETIQDVFWMSTSGIGQMVYISPAYEKVWGRTTESLYKSPESFLEVVHPDDREQLRSIIQEHHSKGKEYTCEYRIIPTDDSVRWIRERGFPIHDDRGKLTLMCGVCTDITERKRAEEKLKESDSQKQAILDGITANLAFVNENLEILWANKTAADSVAKLPSQMVGRKCHEFWADPGKPCDGCPTAKAFKTKRSEHATTVTPDGRVWDEKGEPVFDAEGRLMGVVEIALDITERKEMEEALRSSEAQYRTLFEESRDAIYVTSRDGTLIEANQAFLNLFGFTREDARDLNILRVYCDPAGRKLFMEQIERHGSLENYEVKFQKKDGTEIDCLLTFTLRLDKDGNILGYQGIVRDITHQKNLQKQLLQAQKMEAIGTLAGGIAHDFNNLLTVVMGFAELLLAEKDQKHPEYADIQKIFHAAENGAELVQRLLMFSRKSEPKPVPINLNKQVLQVEKLLRRTVPKMIDIKLELSADLPQINADPSQVEQVLMNLAVNARDAMPDAGKLTVRTDIVKLDEEYCRLHVEATPGEYVVLEVSDTGCGMDKETAEHIFEPFFTTKEMGRGTGLGLAMVYGIVAQHSGHITVYSEVGHGTTFRVYLPAIEDEAEADVETTAIMPGVGTENVLLVDDEEFVRELGTRILTKQGYTVLPAENGREALEIFKKERSRISLVILDLIMPEMGGTECLKELMKIDPQVNILIASGFSADGSVRQTIHMGAKGFVTKPFRVKDLLRDVRKVLDEG